MGKKSIFEDALSAIKGGVDFITGTTARSDERKKKKAERQAKEAREKRLKEIEDQEATDEARKKATKDRQGKLMAQRSRGQGKYGGTLISDGMGSSNTSGETKTLLGL